MEKKPTAKEDPPEVLYQDPDGDFTITAEDVDLAIEEGKQRMGPEFAERLKGEETTLKEEQWKTKKRGSQRSLEGRKKQVKKCRAGSLRGKLAVAPLMRTSLSLAHNVHHQSYVGGSRVCLE